MLSVELSVNVLLLLGIMIMSGLTGFALKRWNIVKIRERLYRVENELIRSHAEILELQKDCLSTEQQPLSISTPVIVINGPPDKSNKKLPNAEFRKKLLTNVLTTAHTKVIS